MDEWGAAKWDHWPGGDLIWRVEFTGKTPVHDLPTISGRVHLLPFCEITLTAPKPNHAYPKVLNTLGDHLKKRRLDLGLFQKDVAVWLGVDDSTILNWEHGRAQPPVRFIPRIIHFLDYDPYPAPKSLAEKLVAKRRQLGLSRKRMAARLGVDEGTLKRWESGTVRATGKRIETVKEFLASDA